MEFVGLTIGKIIGHEFDLTDFVVGAALGHRDDGEEAPVCLVDGLIEVRLQVGFAGVWVGSGDEVIGEPEEVGAVAGAHELQGGVGFCLAEVEGLAAGGIGFAALARAQRKFSRPGGFYQRRVQRVVHNESCVDQANRINRKAEMRERGVSDSSVEWRSQRWDLISGRMAIMADTCQKFLQVCESSASRFL